MCKSQDKTHEFPMGSFIWNTAKDAQTEDLRQITADTVWEFCCRTLCESAVTQSIRTSHISMMILHWCETADNLQSSTDDNCRLMDSFFDHVSDEMTDKLNNAMTDKDLDALRVKCIRLKVHAELEAVHAEVMHQEKDCIIDLDVDGCLMSNPEGMVVRGPNNEEIVLSNQQESELVAAAYQKQLQEDMSQNIEAESWGPAYDVDLLQPRDQTVVADSDIVALSNKFNKKWISKMNTGLEEARAQQRREHCAGNWKGCHGLDITIADIKTEIFEALSNLEAVHEKTKDAIWKQKLHDCMLQLTCLLGDSAIDCQTNNMSKFTEEQLQHSMLALEQQHAAAIQNENNERAAKIKDVMTLHREWQEDLRSKNHVKAFHTLTCLKSARRRLEKDKPLVDPPQIADIIRDSDKQPYWIPGAFPTIFQNETGDPYNYFWKEPDLQLWGPHILMSKGWVAQEHPTFMYWWLNMMQRKNANSAKKWFIGENKDSVGWTVEEHTSKGGLWLRLIERIENNTT